MQNYCYDDSFKKEISRFSILQYSVSFDLASGIGIQTDPFYSDLFPLASTLLTRARKDFHKDWYTDKAYFIRSPFITSRKYSEVLHYVSMWVPLPQPKVAHLQSFSQVSPLWQPTWIAALLNYILSQGDDTGLLHLACSDRDHFCPTEKWWTLTLHKKKMFWRTNELPVLTTWS